MKTFIPANILLPKNADYSKWSVVACDQYTSDRNYWEEVEKLVSDSVSTLKTVLPEVYLEDGNISERIETINQTMQEYLDTDVFKEIKDSFIYTQRTFNNGKTRRGIIGALNLDDYSFEVGAQTLIRATEGTVLERIPPRVKIRKNAPIEFPHIMILIDDEENTVFEGTKHTDEVLYDFDLMQNGGHIVGSKINKIGTEKILKALDQLSNQDVFDKKYGVTGEKPLVFAVGDGNHSLATAKTCKSHYALVEVVNLYDTSLTFEPIHRIIFETDPEKIISTMEKSGMFKIHKTKDNFEKSFEILFECEKYYVEILESRHNLEVGCLQLFLDEYLKTNDGKIDYIHGEDVIEKHVKQSIKNIGFLLPTMNKNKLFQTVILDGVLPRKTFSMGHANEKRFYLEGAKI